MFRMLRFLLRLGRVSGIIELHYFCTPSPLPNLSESVKIDT